MSTWNTEFILALLFINYFIYYMCNCKLTFSSPCMLSEYLLCVRPNATHTFFNADIPMKSSPNEPVGKTKVSLFLPWYVRALNWQNLSSLLEARMQSLDIYEALESGLQKIFQHSVVGKRKRETFICCSTYLGTHWLILVCALTGDGTHDLGVPG